MAGAGVGGAGGNGAAVGPPASASDTRRPITGRYGIVIWNYVFLFIINKLKSSWTYGLTRLAEGALPGEGVRGGVDAHGDGALLVAALLPLEAGREGAAHGVREPLAAVARCQEPVAHPAPRGAVAADVAADIHNSRYCK